MDRGWLTAAEVQGWVADDAIVVDDGANEHPLRERLGLFRDNVVRAGLAGLDNAELHAFHGAEMRAMREEFDLRAAIQEVQPVQGGVPDAAARVLAEARVLALAVPDAPMPLQERQVRAVQFVQRHAAQFDEVRIAIRVQLARVRDELRAMHEAAAEAEAVQDADMPNLEEAEEEGRILREDIDYARRAEEEGRILREEHRRAEEAVANAEAGANAEEAVPILEEAWSCSTCTYFNANPLYLVCDMCNNPRPPPNQVSVM